MVQMFKLFFVYSLLAALVGCAAMGVPVTSDPAKKLGYAGSLYDQQGRPIPAERLIQEAIEIYEEQQNELGLAEAYRQYAFFFRSASVRKHEEYYRSVGFRDKSATFDSRYLKSIEYFEKARDLYMGHEKHDGLMNVYLNMGFTYQLMDTPKAACPVFDKSLSSYNEYLKSHPDANLQVPSGFSSFEDYIYEVKRSGSCQ